MNKWILGSIVAVGTVAVVAMILAIVALSVERHNIFRLHDWQVSQDGQIRTALNRIGEAENRANAVENSIEATIYCREDGYPTKGYLSSLFVGPDRDGELKLSTRFRFDLQSGEEIPAECKEYEGKYFRIGDDLNRIQAVEARLNTAETDVYAAQTEIAVLQSLTPNRVGAAIYCSEDKRPTQGYLSPFFVLPGRDGKLGLDTRFHFDLLQPGELTLCGQEY